MDINIRVNNLMNEMTKLANDLYNTNVNDINIEQLKILSKFSLGYSVDIDCIIKCKTNKF